MIPTCLRKTLLLCALVSFSTVANIGDSITQSYQRYRQPVSTKHNVYTFRRTGWTIEEWVNPDNSLVEMVAYTLDNPDQKIGKAGYARLCQANLPSYLEPDSEWDTQDYRMDNATHNWYAISASKDGKYVIEYGKHYYTKEHFHAYLSIALASSRNQAGWDLSGD